MNARQLPFLAFLALALGLWAAMEYKPSPALPTASAMPPLSIVKLGESKLTVWQPTPDTVTVVNFFASWCVPCLAEHPQLKKLAKVKGVALVGIAWNDKAAALDAWLVEHGNPFDEVWRDVNGSAAMSAGLRGVPETYVVGKDGRIKLHISGAMTEAQADQLILKLVEWRDAQPAP